MQYFFCKLVQMSNFGRLKSENGHFWIDYFQIWDKSIKSIPRIWWALLRSSNTTKKICSPMQCFFCKLVQMSNFGRLKSENGHFWIDYFQIWGNSPKSISSIWWALLRSSIPAKNICSPIQCFLCKLVQISNFGRFNSAIEHILARLFPNLRPIPKIHQTDMVGIMYKLHSAKNICSPIQCFFCKLVQMSNFDRLNSANEHILERLFPNLRQFPKIHLAYMVVVT